MNVSLEAGRPGRSRTAQEEMNWTHAAAATQMDSMVPVAARNVLTPFIYNNACKTIPTVPLTGRRWQPH